MKCPKCNVENKEEAKVCKKCGTSLALKPVWTPNWQWHAKTLGIIFGVLIILFFSLNALFKPYMRKLPKDITPWLKSVQETK
ncbi:MAG: hypothetical protein A2252_00580 [Elusimicrobia bacterium RIFOXYA2_FULL_39_19]|nr:MAG: hypothetical protein A2252_00580 [Elusimicrobia bacterium RIFOXYA2_FULL_39_19]